MRRLLTFTFLFAVAVVPASGSAQQRGEAPAEETAPRQVEVRVTERGLIPSVIKLAQDEVIEVRVVRESKGACEYFEIPHDDFIKRLPVGEPTSIFFRGHSRGRFGFGCGASGVFIVE